MHTLPQFKLKFNNFIKDKVLLCLKPPSPFSYSVYYADEFVNSFSANSPLNPALNFSRYLLILLHVLVEFKHVLKILQKIDTENIPDATESQQLY